MSCYISAANDVWSLGVILVNLTCGRNPWKCASIEDSTFRAYLKDPYFLKTILPLSTEMNCILSRIFERDPAKRLTIPELRDLIVECPRFTITPMAPSRSTCPSPNEQHAATEVSIRLQGCNPRLEETDINGELA
jgi:serine/threonine protein kinase